MPKSWKNIQVIYVINDVYTSCQTISSVALNDSIFALIKMPLISTLSSLGKKSHTLKVTRVIRGSVT